MIGLLFYFQQHPPERYRQLFFRGPVVCLPSIYGYGEKKSDNDYDLLPAKTSRQKLKNLLTFDLKATRQIFCIQQTLLIGFSALCIKVFKAHIQSLTGDKAIVFSSFLFTPNASFFLSQGFWSSLLKSSPKYPFYRKGYEHFNRLRSLFGHELKWDQTQKGQERRGVYLKK